MIKALLFLLSMAFADSQEFLISLGIQTCIREDDVTQCGGTDYITTKEILDLEGNTPWVKESEKYIAQVLIKRRAPNYIVHLNILSLQGDELGSYATDVKSLEDLNKMKLGSGAITINKKQYQRVWIKVSKNP